MAGTTVQARNTGMRGSDVAAHNDAQAALVADLAYINGNKVLTLGGAGLSDDGNAQDIETDNAIHIQSMGLTCAFAAVAALDLSASGSVCTVPGAATISTSKSGCLWVFANPSGTLDAQTDSTTAAWTSAIQSIAQYAAPAVATRLLPLTALDVPIGCVQVTEGGSGAFTWGTDSIAAETETYYNFVGRPGVLTACASFAVDAAAATFTYGAGKGVLGTGVYVSYTGKANVTLPVLPATTIAVNDIAAYLIYVLADDTEYAFALGFTYKTLAEARAAVLAHTRNPLLIWIGTLYISNRSAAVFTPATTNLDATGITCTFDTCAATTVTTPLITVSA